MYAQTTPVLVVSSISNTRTMSSYGTTKRPDFLSAFSTALWLCNHERERLALMTESIKGDETRSHVRVRVGHSIMEEVVLCGIAFLQLRCKRVFVTSLQEFQKLLVVHQLAATHTYSHTR